MGVESKSWAKISGRDEGRGGEGWRICCGGGPEIRRRLRGGGLTSGDGIVLYRQAVKKRFSCNGKRLLYFGFTNTSGEAFVQKPLRLTLSYVVRVWLNLFALMPIILLYWETTSTQALMPRSLAACLPLDPSEICV